VRAQDFSPGPIISRDLFLSKLKFRDDRERQEFISWMQQQPGYAPGDKTVAEWWKYAERFWGVRTPASPFTGAARARLREQFSPDDVRDMETWMRQNVGRVGSGADLFALTVNDYWAGQALSGADQEYIRRLADDVWETQGVMPGWVAARRRSLRQAADDAAFPLNEFISRQWGSPLGGEQEEFKRFVQQRGEAGKLYTQNEWNEVLAEFEMEKRGGMAARRRFAARRRRPQVRRGRRRFTAGITPPPDIIAQTLRDQGFGAEEQGFDVIVSLNRPLRRMEVELALGVTVPSENIRQAGDKVIVSAQHEARRAQEVIHGKGASPGWWRGTTGGHWWNAKVYDEPSGELPYGIKGSRVSKLYIYSGASAGTKGATIYEWDRGQGINQAPPGLVDQIVAELESGITPYASRRPRAPATRRRPSRRSTKAAADLTAMTAAEFGELDGVWPRDQWLQWCAMNGYGNKVMNYLQWDDVYTKLYLPAVAEAIRRHAREQEPVYPAGESEEDFVQWAIDTGKLTAAEAEEFKQWMSPKYAARTMDQDFSSRQGWLFSLSQWRAGKPASRRRYREVTAGDRVEVLWTREPDVWKPGTVIRPAGQGHWIVKMDDSQMEHTIAPINMRPLRTSRRHYREQDGEPEPAGTIAPVAPELERGDPAVIELPPDAAVLPQEAQVLWLETYVTYLEDGQEPATHQAWTAVYDSGWKQDDQGQWYKDETAEMVVDTTGQVGDIVMMPESRRVQAATAQSYAETHLLDDEQTAVWVGWLEQQGYSPEEDEAPEFWDQLMRQWEASGAYIEGRRRARAAQPVHRLREQQMVTAAQYARIAFPTDWGRENYYAALRAEGIEPNQEMDRDYWEGWHHKFSGLQALGDAMIAQALQRSGAGMASRRARTARRVREADKVPFSEWEYQRGHNFNPDLVQQFKQWVTAYAEFGPNYQATLDDWDALYEEFELGGGGPSVEGRRRTREQTGLGAGTRVRLISLYSAEWAEEQYGLRPGMEGTIVGTYEAWGDTIYDVKWDSGVTAGLHPIQDKFEVISRAAVARRTWEQTSLRGFEWVDRQMTLDNVTRQRLISFLDHKGVLGAFVDSSYMVTLFDEFWDNPVWNPPRPTITKPMVSESFTGQRKEKGRMRAPVRATIAGVQEERIEAWMQANKGQASDYEDLADRAINHFGAMGWMQGPDDEMFCLDLAHEVMLGTPRQYGTPGVNETRRLRVQEQTDFAKMPAQMLEGLCESLGPDPGFHGRCMDKNFGDFEGEITDKAAFCAELHKQCVGKWPAEEAQRRASFSGYWESKQSRRSWIRPDSRRPVQEADMTMEEFFADDPDRDVILPGFKKFMDDAEWYTPGERLSREEWVELLDGYQDKVAQGLYAAQRRAREQDTGDYTPPLRPGDFVEITGGEHAGKEGVIEGGLTGGWSVRLVDGLLVTVKDEDMRRLESARPAREQEDKEKGEKEEPKKVDLDAFAKEKDVSDDDLQGFKMWAGKNDVDVDATKTAEDWQKAFDKFKGKGKGKEKTEEALSLEDLQAAAAMAIREEKAYLGQQTDRRLVIGMGTGSDVTRGDISDEEMKDAFRDLLPDLDDDQLNEVVNGRQ
jgi:hypothetical protein